MIKRDGLIEKLAAKGYTKKGAGLIIDDIARTITELLADGEDVMIHGFGTFYVREIAERATIDLASKERIIIPGHKAPKFTAGEHLKRAVREGFVRD